MWTDTAEEAYGVTGKKGKTAEDIHDDLMRQYGFEVLSYENNREMQELGIDSAIIFNEWYTTTDVKGNWKPDGSFYVEADGDGWLIDIKKVSEFITHVNVYDGRMFCYRRVDMINHLSDHKVPIVVIDGARLYFFDRTQLCKCDFITYVN